MRFQHLTANQSEISLLSLSLLFILFYGRRWRARAFITISNLAVPGNDILIFCLAMWSNADADVDADEFDEIDEPEGMDDREVDIRNFFLRFRFRVLH
jgi:hypothetical protein